MIKIKKIKLNKKTYIAICVLVITTAIIISIFLDKNEEKNIGYLNSVDNIDILTDNINSINKIDTDIFIHITGEILNPGVYKLKENSRIKDAIEIAGGLKDTADITNVNLVYQLCDGQKIIIPKVGENNSEINTIISYENGENIVFEGDRNKKKININKATQTELECITGVGPSLASKIIEYRKKNGKFSSIDELKSVPGIGEAKYNSMVEEITV